MKCMECGHSVGNWPGWLGNTSIEVRCSKCAGSGTNVINAPKSTNPIQFSEMTHRPDEVLKAA